MPETGFQIENPMKPASILLLERTAFRNLDKSAPRGRGTRFLIFDKLKMSKLRPLLFQEGNPLTLLRCPAPNWWDMPSSHASCGSSRSRQIRSCLLRID